MKQLLSNIFCCHCVLANEARDSKPISKHLQLRDLAQIFTCVLSDEFHEREEIGWALNYFEGKLPESYMKFISDKIKANAQEGLARL